MNCKNIGFTALLLATSVSSLAQEQTLVDTGWYIGGAIGHQSSELKDSATSKSTDASFGVFGGYNFQPWFGLEGSFYLGETDVDGSSSLRSAGFGVLSITPKFTLAINDAAALYVKAGLASIGYSEEYRSGSRYSRSNTESWSGAGTSLGIGAEYRIHNGVKIRLSYDQFRATLEDVDDYYADIDAELFQTSFGVYYQF